MTNDSARPARGIHLLTTEGVLADLISGREILVTGKDPFALDTEDSRAVLGWYRDNGKRWAGNQRAEDIEAIINAVESPLPIVAAPADDATTTTKRSLKLVRMVAHRFAGLHVHGKLTDAPDPFVFTPTSDVTLLEGANGSGKTSILNAIVWCITGELIRSQRGPESGLVDFPCEVTRADGSQTTHPMSAVTPMPNSTTELPEDGKPIPADTWVELTFADRDGTPLPPIRRHQTRTPRGKLEEAKPDLDALGLDPIAWRIATTMPALLPFLTVGSTSQLGTAVARLTGLANLVDLAKHATNAAGRIRDKSTKEIGQEIGRIRDRYAEHIEDLATVTSENPEIAFDGPVPSINAADTEQRLSDIAEHFSKATADGLAIARSVLGDGFDPQQKMVRDDLDQSIRPAVVQLRQVSNLPSITRLAKLSVTPEQVEEVDRWFDQIHTEAAKLAELAESPGLARRAQLYALVSNWIHQHDHSDDGRCPVCTSDLDGACDPVTGSTVAGHLTEAEATRELIAQTVAQWAANWHGRLLRQLPDVIASEVRGELPSVPADLLIAGLTTELYATEGFRGALAALAEDSDQLVSETATFLPLFDEPELRTLPASVAGRASDLLSLMRRIDRALAFADWRTNHSDELLGFVHTIRNGDDGDPNADRAIGRRLKTLLKIVESVAPLKTAATCIDRMEASRVEYVAKVERLALCGRAAAALDQLRPLGTLAQAQVDGLRSILQKRSDHWRRQMYQNATTYAPDLTGTEMDANGTLGLQVGRDGVTAPAQHISNASALRGALLGFFLAFREHVLNQRGGLLTLVLDDPQELLDNDNRERLARGLSGLAAKAQLLITTHDRKFARCLVAERRDLAEHLSVHPVNSVHPTIFVAPAQEEVDRKRVVFLESPDNHGAAQDYAADLRVFLEARLGDLFDTIAHPAYSTVTKPLTLIPLVDRLRGMVTGDAGELFGHSVVKQFVDDAAFAQGAEGRRVLNQSHHDKASITYMDVKQLDPTFTRLRSNVEKVHQHFRLIRWREPTEEVAPQATNVVLLQPLVPPVMSIPICPDIAAFMGASPAGGSQDVGEDVLEGTWFEGKSLYYIRGSSLGFAVPPSSVAIVEAEPYAGRDHNLVIARVKGKTYARRLARSPGSIGISLSAQMPDPRDSRPTLTFDESKVRLHRIVGAMFSDMPPPDGGGEASPVEQVPELQSVQVAYRVKEDSAIPLALPGQIVLGGAELTATDLDAWEGRLVAVTLEDGSSIFKRVGSRLPGGLGYLRQFETIGGLGASMVVATEAIEGGDNVPLMVSARRVIGVLYG